MKLQYLGCPSGVTHTWEAVSLFWTNLCRKEPVSVAGGGSGFRKGQTDPDQLHQLRSTDPVPHQGVSRSVPLSPWVKNQINSVVSQKNPRWASTRSKSLLNISSELSLKGYSDELLLHFHWLRELRATPPRPSRLPRPDPVTFATKGVTLFMNTSCKVAILFTKME